MQDEDFEIDDPDAHRFILEKPFKYATKSGNQESASWIELHPPTTRNSRECAALKQAFFRAANESGADSEDGEATEIDGDARGPQGAGIIAIMAMSTKVDLPEIMEVARKLFSSGVAQVDGETKLTTRLIESMAQDDFERMLGEYLVNFTLASALARNTKPSSKP